MSEKLWGQGLNIIQMDQTRMRLLGELIAHARVRVCLVGGMWKPYGVFVDMSDEGRITSV